MDGNKSVIVGRERRQRDSWKTWKINGKRWASGLNFQHSCLIWVQWLSRNNISPNAAACGHYWLGWDPALKGASFCVLVNFHHQNQIPLDENQYSIFLPSLWMTATVSHAAVLVLLLLHTYLHEKDESSAKHQQPTEVILTAPGIAFFKGLWNALEEELLAASFGLCRTCFKGRHFSWRKLRSVLCVQETSCRRIRGWICKRMVKMGHGGPSRKTKKPAHETDKKRPKVAAARIARRDETERFRPTWKSFTFGFFGKRIFRNTKNKTTPMAPW